MKNRSPPSALVDKTPHGVWFGKNPSIAYLRFFGCDAFMHVPKEKRRKLDNKVEKCIFFIYKDEVKGYKLWNLVIRKIAYSQDGVFREVKSTFINEDESKEKGPNKMEFELKNEGFDSFEEEPSKSNDVEPQTPSLRRSNHVRRPTERYSPLNLCSSFVLSAISDETRSVKEVVGSKECKLWTKAMVEEMKALDKNEA